MMRPTHSTYSPRVAENAKAARLAAVRSVLARLWTAVEYKHLTVADLRVNLEDSLVSYCKHCLKYGYRQSNGIKASGGRLFARQSRGNGDLVVNLIVCTGHEDIELAALVEDTAKYITTHNVLDNWEHDLQCT